VPTRPGTPNRPTVPTGPAKSDRPAPRSPAAARKVGAPILVTPATTDNDPASVNVREPVRTVGVGDEEIELRAVSPEERARRRLKKNLILWAIGLILIAITLAILLLTGPITI
jgi:hypothetical protein